MNQEALFEKAIMLIKHKEYDEAENIIKQLIEKNPGKEMLYLTLGNIYSFKNKPQQALDVYEKALQIAPENPDICSNIGLIYKQKGDIDNAVSYLQRALSFGKGRADIYYNLGNVYKQSKDYSTAEKIFLEAIKIQPEFVQVYNNLGALYMENGELEKAEDIINRGLSIDKNHPRLLYNLGVLKDLQGKSEEAIDLYKHSIVTQPLWVESLNNLGVAYHKTDLHRKAIKTFNSALDVEPDNHVVKNNIAVSYKSVGEEKKAKEYYKEAINQNPEYIKASINLSELYRETGDYDSALSELNRIETINPADEEIKIHKAHVYFDKGEFESAEKIINHSVKSEVKSKPAAFALKALLSIKKGKTKEAAEYIEKAGVLEPGNVSLKSAKAELYKQQGDLEKAEKEFKDILFLNKGNLRASLELAKLLKEQEKYEDAVSVLDSLKGDYRYYSDTITEYSDIYKKTGQTEKALEYSNKLLGKVGEDHSQIDISSLNKGLELFEEASKSYEILNNSKMEERLSHFVKEYVKNDQEKNIPQDSLSFLIGSVDGLNDEQVPIIDIGGIEPVIEINEEEEIHALDEDDEDFDYNEDNDDAERGLYEQTKEKIEKEFVEKLEKQNPGLFPGQLSSPNLLNPSSPVPRPSFSPHSPPIQSPGQEYPQHDNYPPPPIHYPRQEYPQQDNYPPPHVETQQVTTQALSGSAEKEQENMLEKYDGVEEPEGESFESLAKDSEYVNEDIAALLDSLEGLTDFLGEGRKDKYEHSVMKLKIEALKRKLGGSKGLLDTLAPDDEDQENTEPEEAEEEKEEEIVPEKRSKKERRAESDRRNSEDRRTLRDRRDEIKTNNEVVTTNDLESAFSYIKSLTDFLPQNMGRNVMKLKISNLLEKIEEKKNE